MIVWTGRHRLTGIAHRPRGTIVAYTIRRDPRDPRYWIATREIRRRGQPPTRETIVRDMILAEHVRAAVEREHKAWTDGPKPQPQDRGNPLHPPGVRE